TINVSDSEAIHIEDCRNTRVLDVYASENGFSGINVMGSDRHSSGNIVSRNCRAENTVQEMLNSKLAGSDVNQMFNGSLLTNLDIPRKLHELTGFILKNNSPLKESGVNITALYGYIMPSTDFFGNRIPAGMTIVPGIYMLRRQVALRVKDIV
ncbi:MAG TPA: hypothetical protein VJ963_02735, partial [Bacteroidales bacterium]|nr:hypothetical protein [Bacteroidales bacterium]